MVRLFIRVNGIFNRDRAAQAKTQFHAYTNPLVFISFLVFRKKKEKKLVPIPMRRGG